eukprot:15400639-Heterocapsa_arctica.AAC.1
MRIHPLIVGTYPNVMVPLSMLSMNFSRVCRGSSAYWFSCTQERRAYVMSARRTRGRCTPRRCPCHRTPTSLQICERRRTPWSVHATRLCPCSAGPWR